MKYTYARFKNYIPFYNGLGLHELEIDFSSSTNRIIVISGINGCGKSSLLNALHPMPDNSNLYMDGLHAEKELCLTDGEHEYHIFIRSPITKSGRGPTKATIMKDGVELNPNGNVGSYKEIVFSEFDLNPNFISLSRLSSSDRGLADKLPSERKKFMSTIIESLEVYNEIYKELNKKANIFRSYINNLHAKIQNIGDEQALSINLSNLVHQSNQIKAEEDELKAIIATEQAKISIHDPDGNIQDRFLRAEKNLHETETEKDTLFVEFERICASLGLPPNFDQIEKESARCDEVRENTEKQMMVGVAMMNQCMEKSNSLSMNLERIKIKMEELDKEIDLELTAKRDKCKENCRRLQEMLVRRGLIDRCATAQEVELIRKYMQKVLDLVDQFYQDSDPETIKLGVDPVKLNDEMTQVARKREFAKNALMNAQAKLQELESDAETIKILDNRPNACTVDECPFIATAFTLQNRKYSETSVYKWIDSVKNEIDIYTKNFEESNERFNFLQTVGVKCEIFSKIRETVLEHEGLFCKVIISRDFFYDFENLLKQGNNFNKFRDLGVLSEISKMIIDNDKELRMLSAYETDIKIQSNNLKQWEDLQQEKTRTEKELKDSDMSVITWKKDISSWSASNKEIGERILTLINAEATGKKYKKAEDAYTMALAEYKEAKSISISSIDSFNRLGEARQKLKEAEAKRSTMDISISQLQGQLSMLDSYKADYHLYDKKYKMIDLIRKYTSPSKGGIQSLYIQLYMAKTLELANQLLQMLFSGEYRLLDFVIDSNEFRIPFIGSGMMVDDISSGSTSQICIIGSIINLVLLHQASSKYNIASLDETDSGLDNYNRSIYGSKYLPTLVSVLGIEQLFVISHSAEVELVNVDIIRLRQHENFDSSAHKGNIIYDYSQETKTFE